jgi:hypothetical protein
VGLEDHVSDEEADPIDDDADVRRALTEAFVAKTKRQEGILGTGSGADAAVAAMPGGGAGAPGTELEKPSDCKNQ